MPIYEFACPKCRVIFNFLSKRLNPEGTPSCPKCGHRELKKQMSSFAMISGENNSDSEEAPSGESPDFSGFDESKMMRAMGEIERDMGHMDENNPKHMAMMMRKMQEVMPTASPKPSTNSTRPPSTASSGVIFTTVPLVETSTPITANPIRTSPTSPPT